MASMSSLNSISVLSEDILHCPNCGNLLKDPKILPCLHSFCLDCLETCLEKADIAPEESFYCPLCRSKCTLPKNGIHGLKDNVLVQSIEAFLDFRNEILNEETVACGGCNRNGLIKAKAVKCVECNEWLCKTCSDAHVKVKASNKHNLLTSKDLLSGQQDDLIKENMASNFCQKHLMRFISFCEDCDSLVCELCQTTKHHLHLLTPINLHSAKESFTVRAYLPLVNKSINNFQLRISNLKKQHKNLVYFRKTFHKEFAERILKVIDRITFKLQSYADILHIVVDNLLDDHIEKLKKHDIEKLKDQLELAKITYSFANNLLEYDFPTCTIPLSNTVQKQLSLFKKPPKTKTPKLRAFSLNAQEKLSIELIEEMIGEIQLDGKDKNDTSLINFSCKLKNDKFPCVISDLSIDHDNSKLVVVDEANKNLKSFNFDGSFDCYSQDSYFKNPIRVVVLRNNHDYLINDENTIKRSDKSFKNLNLFSKHKFRQPVGICQSSNGEILVCEWLSGQVLGFDEIGTLVRTFPCHSRNPAYISCCFTCDHIIISDWKTHSVKLFHWNGNLINSYGESKDNTLEHNEKQLSLNHPHGVCSDAEDNILVCDSWNNRIKILDWKGRYKNTLLDLKNGLKCPQAIDVTYNHCFIAERHGFIKVFEYFLNKDV